MNRSTRNIMENLALVSQIGLMMIVPILFGVFIGNYLDERFGVTPLFLIIMIILGVGSAFRNLMSLGKKKSSDYDNEYSPKTYVENYTKKQIAEDEETNKFEDLDKDKKL